MARCLLSDIPDALFQVILQRLYPADHASLRQVKRSIWTRMTANIPHLVVKLSDSSTTAHLQKWLRITQRYLHVNSIHIHVTGEVSAHIFNSAMQLLSERGTVRQLHLLAADVSTTSSSKPRIPSLLPIKHLESQLNTLVVKEVAVQDLASDLRQLAEASAGGWNLQNLTITADWWYPLAPGAKQSKQLILWSRFVYAAKQLVTAFPKLQQLAIRLPPIGYNFQLPPVTDTGLVNSMSVINSVIAQDNPVYPEDEVVTHISGDCWTSLILEEHHPRVKVATARVAAVAGLMNTVMQLQQLQTLTVTQLHDIWKRSSKEDNFWRYVKRVEPGTSAVEITTALQQKRAAEAAEAAAAVGALEPSTSAGLLGLTSAAEAFPTMDDTGCWLLQHHPTLQELHISTGHNSRWSMSWQQQQQQVSSASSSNGEHATAAAPELLAVTVDWRVGPSLTNHRAADLQEPGNAGSSTEGSRHNQRFKSGFMQYISVYSPQPAAQFLQLITSCELRGLKDWHLDCLAGVLSDLKSLKHLKVGHDYVRQRPRHGQIFTIDTSAAATVIQAASVVHQLQSLSVYTMEPKHQLPDDLLYPLTAAAGGPGSSLTRLELVLDFTSAVKEPRAAAAAGREPADQSTIWLETARQLTELLHLKISLEGSPRTKVKFSADNLPCKLKVVSLKNLTITAGTAATAVAAAAGRKRKRAADVNSSSAGASRNTSVADQLQLQQLSLECCRLQCSPSDFASDQLQQLTVIDSSWSGGWPAAAAAWPNVQKLVWVTDKCEGSKLSKHGSSGTHVAMPVLPATTTTTAAAAAADNGQAVVDDQGADGGSSSSAMDTAADLIIPKLTADHLTAKRVLQDLSAGFRGLTSLTLRDLPWLNIEALSEAVLQRVVQMPNIQYVNLCGVRGRYAIEAKQEVGSSYDREVYNKVMRKKLRVLNKVTGHGVPVEVNLAALQRWLRQLPWAVVDVACIRA